MNKSWTFLFLIALLCARAKAADEFAEVKCGSDISKALVGKRTSATRVVVIEGRHKELGLKDLGGFQAVKRIGKDFEINGAFTYERYKAPMYLPGEQTVTTTNIQLTWFPGRKVSF